MSGGAPDYLYVVLPLVLLAGCVWLRPCVTGRLERGEDAYTALLSPSVRTARTAFDRRVAIAVREAKLGFFVCRGCGFTNSVRLKACALCATAVATKKKGIKARFANGQLGPTNPSHSSSSQPALLPWRSLTSRQRRVRRRKEWTREVLPDGSIVWARDSRPAEENVDSFATYVLQTTRRDVDKRKASLRMERASKPDHVEVVVEPSEGVEELRDVEILTVRRVVDSLRDELDGAGISYVAVAAGDDASARALDSVHAVEHRPADSVALAKLDFPSKLAQFITIMAALFNKTAGYDDDGEEVSTKSRFFIDRDNLLADSIAAIATMTESDARGAIRIEFTAEQGIDAGGVYREWFLLLNQQLIAPEAGLFVCVDPSNQSFYLNPHSRHILGEHHLAHFFAAGRLLGRALLEGNVTGFHLALPLLKIILGLPVDFRDLEHFDPDVYKSLSWLLENGGVDALCLDFTVTEKLPDGTTRVVELVPGGGLIEVADANKREYVDRNLRYLLFESVSRQLLAFRKGLYEVVPPQVLLVFDAEELDLVLSGSDEIDVDDWQAHTIATTELVLHPAYELFWRIVRELSLSERRRLLQFATGSTRVPPGGFGALASHDGRLGLFTLKGVPPETTHGYLHSHACFNTLDVPLHGMLGNMRTAVRAAITSRSLGFTTA